MFGLNKKKQLIVIDNSENGGLDIVKRLKEENLVFWEEPSRMSYGLIGHIKQNEALKVMMFQTTFYVHDKNFPINTKTLQLIQDIQKVYKDLTRDENNRIIVNEKGVGSC